MTRAADLELDGLRRPFRLGVLACLAGIVCVGGIIAAFGTPADRPAGVAERWLTAVADLTRDGLTADAEGRLEALEIPGESAGAALLASFPEADAARTEGEALFETIRVGRPIDVDGGGEQVIVPVEVTLDGDVSVSAYVALSKADGSWRVGELTSLDPAASCAGPCEGFPLERPERAPLGYWLGALMLGALITVACAYAIRAATPHSPRP